MGIRIRRHLGYALTDFEGEQDPRINKDKFSNRWDLCDEYVKFVTEHTDQAVEILEHELGVESYRAHGWKGSIGRMDRDNLFKYPDPVTYSPEFGKENVFLLQPIHRQDWSRCDDIIDHYMHQSQHQRSYEPELIDLREELSLTTLYPYPSWMHRHPDAEVPEEAIERFLDEQRAYSLSLSFPHMDGFGIKEGKLEGQDYNRMVGLWSKEMKPSVKNQQLLTHLRQNWYAHIPPDIRLFAHWAGIFEDFNTVYTLKPVVYSYWS